MWVAFGCMLSLIVLLGHNVVGATVSQLLFRCWSCKKEGTTHNPLNMLQCGHCACTKCLHDFVMSHVDDHK